MSQKKKPLGTDPDGAKLTAARWDSGGPCDRGTDGPCDRGTDDRGTDSLLAWGKPMTRTLGRWWVRSLRQLGWAVHSVTTEAAKCSLRSSIPYAARSRARQVAAWMLLRSRGPIARDTDSDAGSDTKQLGVPGF